MYCIITTANPASAASNNANHADAREVASEKDKRREDLDSYVPYVDYVPGRDV